MTTSSQVRLSRDQIMCGIREVMEDLTGNLPIHDETRIDHLLKEAGWWDDIDLIGLVYRLENWFSFTCPRSEWEPFFGIGQPDLESWERNVGPRFTFGALADFIASRMVPIPVGPLCILGRPCATAGAFRSLEVLVRELDPKAPNFGPSTSLRKRLRGESLERLWRRVAWLTKSSVPELRRTRVTRLGEALYSVGFLAFCIGFPASLFTVVAAALINDWSFGWVAVSLACASVGVASFLTSQALGRMDNRLPAGIRTFGDLARRMATHPAYQESAQA